MGNRAWFAIAIHDTRNRPKSVRTMKKSVGFQGLGVDGKLLWLEWIVSCGVLFMGYQTRYLGIQSFKLFQIIVARSKKRTFSPF